MSDPTKAAILQQSSTGWSPLRINKRSPPSHSASPASPPVSPPKGTPTQRGAPRRSSASFAHLRSHSLVSNSPFKSPDVKPEGAKFRPHSAFAGLGITVPPDGGGLTRRVTPRRGVEEENEDPAGGRREERAVKPRKSRGLQELRQAAYVSRSPFLEDGSPTASPTATFESQAYVDGKDEMEKGLPSPVSPNTPAPPPVPPKADASALPTSDNELPLPPPHPSNDTALALMDPPPLPPISILSPSPSTSPSKKPPSLTASPRRPALTSHRLHGPRSNSVAPGAAGRRVSSGRGKRRRRQTVRFEERCDVLIFERDEGEEGWEEGEEGEWEEDWDEEEEEEEEDGGEEGGLRVRNFSPTDSADTLDLSPQLANMVELLVNESPFLAPLTPSPILPPPPPGPTAPVHVPSPLPTSTPVFTHSHALVSTQPRFDSVAEEAEEPSETDLERMERDVEAILASAGGHASFATTASAQLSFASNTDASVSVEERDVTELSLSTVELTRSSIVGDGSAVDAGRALGEVDVTGSGSMIFHPSPPSSEWRTPTAPGTAPEPATPTPHQHPYLHAEEPVHTPTNVERLPREMREDGEDGVPYGRTHHAERRRTAHPLLPHDDDDFNEEGTPPSLPSVVPSSPFVMPSGGNVFGSLSVASPTPHSPRITREDIRARLALGRFGRRGRVDGPGSPGSVHTATTGTGFNTANTTPLMREEGEQSPVPVERAAPVSHGVEVVNPGRGTPVRLDKELPSPPLGGEGGDGGEEGGRKRPEMEERESAGSIVGQRSALERLVEGVSKEKDHQQQSQQKAKRVPVPPVETIVFHSPPQPVQQQPTTTPKMERSRSLKEREEAILASRRERRAREGDGEDDGEGSEAEERREEERRKKLSVPQRERPARRRSMSTGDVQEDKEMKIDDEVIAAVVDQTGFFDSVEREVRKLHQPARSYQIREHQVQVYSSSTPREKVSHVSQAGDVDSGRAWRTVRRPSDMNEYAKQIREYRAAEKPGKALGKVFVRVLSVKGINVPLPAQPAYFTITLNNGIHSVTTPEAKLDKESSIEQEFELIEHSKLEFTLTLKVRKDEHVMAQLRPPPPPMPVTPPHSVATSSKPTTPTHKSAFRALFGSPKKIRQQLPASVRARSQSEAPPPPPAATPDCLAKWLGPDGTLAQASVSFREITKRCDTRLLETSYPLICRFREASNTFSGTSSSAPTTTNQKAVGEIVVQFFRLPALPGVEPDKLPQSLEECHRGLRHVAWHKAVYHEGVLTQNGGDCSTWRRRRFRVVGANMVAFNDVTKKVTATIELKKAVSVEDDQDPFSSQTNSSQKTTIPRSFSSDDNLYTGVQRSFKIVFTGGDEIAFFADTEEEKVKWLQVLRALIGRIPDHPLWAELAWQRQEELAKQAAAVGAKEQVHRKR